MTGGAVQFAPSTIERWYYLARRQNEDPVGALRRAVRKDCGQFSLPPALVARLFAQYRDHEHWTCPLHYEERTLEFLNKASQARVEMEYQRTVHREMGGSPIERFANAPDVLRPSPSSNELRDAFRLQTQRRQRQSDGTTAKPAPSV